MDSKKELEEFLYIVSHDFNAPLRHIREFTCLLLDKLDNGSLKEREKLYASYIKESVKEAEEMLSGLLRYSRLNTIPKDIEEFSFKELVEEVIKTYQSRINIANASITIKCPDNIKVSADREHIKILVKELLDNALKFRASSRNLEIAITAIKENGNIVCSFQDNGIGGITGDLKEKIFNIFKKLNPKEEYPGPGTGLALCKKITEFYNGKIWVESSDNKGSQIFFSILAQN